MLMSIELGVIRLHLYLVKHHRCVEWKYSLCAVFCSGISPL